MRANPHFKTNKQKRRRGTNGRTFFPNPRESKKKQSSKKNVREFFSTFSDGAQKTNVRVPSAGIAELLKISVKPGGGQDIATQTSSTAGNTSFLISAFAVDSQSLFPNTFEQKAMLGTTVNQTLIVMCSVEFLPNFACDY